MTPGVRAQNHFERNLLLFEFHSEKPPDITEQGRETVFLSCALPNSLTHRIHEYHKMKCEDTWGSSFHSNNNRKSCYSPG